MCDLTVDDVRPPSKAVKVPTYLLTYVFRINNNFFFIELSPVTMVIVFVCSGEERGCGWNTFCMCGKGLLLKIPGGHPSGS